MFLFKNLLRDIWVEIVLGKGKLKASGKTAGIWVIRSIIAACIICMVAAGILYLKKDKEERIAQAERDAIEAAAMYNGLHIPVYTEEAWKLIYDRDYYTTIRPGLIEYFGDQPDQWFMYFIEYGIPEAQRASELFDPVYYREHNPDLDEMYGDDWRSYYYHFVNIGYEEGRKGAE